MRDHQQRHIDNRDCIRYAQLSCDCRKVVPGGVVVVEDQVGHSHQIESNDEQPEERADSYCEKRQESEYPSCEVSISGEGGKARRQIRTDDAWNEKDQAEEAEAVQRSDGALRSNLVYCLKPGPEVGAEAKQPRDITQNELLGR